MTAERPNVLLIQTDHWQAHMMRCAGEQAIMTPTLDTLAQNGVRFTNAYSTCPVCIPARRSLMTGLSPRSHGDRVYTDKLPMPPVKTLAQSFRDSGYQAFGVGKLHVYPQRDRIGFDDVILSEEARYYLGMVDDYQTWLAENGYAGMEYMHGISNNDYAVRPWHLPEAAHQTSWATREICRMIKRRNPEKPGLYYVSYVHPHPPLVPLQAYLDLYRDIEIPDPVTGDWESGDDAFLDLFARADKSYNRQDIELAKKAFYAQCTHIDHQMRLIIGTLREEGLLNNTIIAFTSDHGDMLFDHNMVAKRCFYENSANIPLIISGAPLGDLAGTVSDDLACLEDVMPTLLSLCGIEMPGVADGIDLLSGNRRDMLFGEISDGPAATRMAADGRYKLIYYPYGNTVQLFDLDADPKECKNLSGDPAYADVQAKLTQFLIENLHGGDEAWHQNGVLTGMEAPPKRHRTNYGFSNQRGLHWPPPTNSRPTFK